MKEGLIVSACGITASKKEINLDNIYVDGRYVNDTHELKSNISKTSRADVQVYAVCDSGEQALNRFRAADDVQEFFADLYNLNEQMDIDGVLSIPAIWDFVADTDVKIKVSAKRADGPVQGLVFASLFMANGKGIAVNAGDSRVYQVRDGKVLLLSEDHLEAVALLKEGVITDSQYDTFKKRSRLTAYLGMGDLEKQRDLLFSEPFTVLPGDLYLLCTDGVSDTFRQTDLERLFGSYNGHNAADILRILADRAWDKNEDDFGLIILKVEENDVNAVIAPETERKETEPLEDEPEEEPEEAPAAPVAETPAPPEEEAPEEPEEPEEASSEPEEVPAEPEEEPVAPVEEEPETVIEQPQENEEPVAEPSEEPAPEDAEPEADEPREESNEMDNENRRPEEKAPIFRSLNETEEPEEEEEEEQPTRRRGAIYRFFHPEEEEEWTEDEEEDEDEDEEEETDEDDGPGLFELLFARLRGLFARKDEPDDDEDDESDDEDEDDDEEDEAPKRTAYQNVYDDDDEEEEEEEEEDEGGLLTLFRENPRLIFVGIVVLIVLILIISLIISSAKRSHNNESSRPAAESVSESREESRQESREESREESTVESHEESVEESAEESAEESVEESVPEESLEESKEESHSPDDIQTYTVKSGDTMYRIFANAYGSAKNNDAYRKALAKYNGIDDPSKIRTGQVLEIPPISVLDEMVNN